MRSKPLLPVAVTFTLAAALCIGAASLTVTQIEARSVRAIDEALGDAGIDWATVSADGLTIDMAGTAPDEAARFRALSVAGQIVEGTRVQDRMDVAQRQQIAAPRFSIEVLRAEDGISLIGLVPAEMDRLAFLERIARHAFNTPITDLLQTASYPAPEAWDEALDFGIEALARSEKAKISIDADQVEVVTMAQDAEARRALEDTLNDLAPDGVEVALNITAPRPVIAPFILRLTRQGETSRFDACSASTEEGRARILDAAEPLGIDGARCQIGLGVPSPEWADVATEAMRAMQRVPEGTLTISDLAIRIDAAAGTEDFGRTVAALRAGLPPEFSLTALEADAEAVEPDAGPAEFTATRSPEGAVQLSGRVGDALDRATVASYGRALFGGDQVNDGFAPEEEVPAGWTPRLLAGLDALSVLNNGAIRVTEESLSVTGVSGSQDGSSLIAGRLSSRLGDDARYEIEVSYDERLDASLGLPTPEECVAEINNILQTRQITFDPGSATIDPASRDSVRGVAEILGKCESVPMEVGGYTDSQGREEMNRQLSQERAEAVLAALLALRVPVSTLTAMGYGEESPIADNDTPEGREANRRIEFKLLSGEEEAATPDDASAEDAAEVVEDEQEDEAGTAE
ncbi:OmpA-OmpF porin, OOP family [Palleronia marisminoris]|uniref:Putative lipoprotein YiaD n=1 Tax=Palleronia marisminoris TaxID=315423 RepID=A0A1Y5TRX2_9RHOB|nr:OmpA family protein [Palleronia marisminoris]SFH43403.1 OmpA-OmpF porin, OOP family [Palleronia marisminoris]SLN66593.1 putative lipoprotein YiaD precursor [Palleronia marisminoris]